jgi:glycosyltransferase involved in cell wall biosynthesis
MKHSVILPTRGRMDGLARAVQSIGADCEIVIVSADPEVKAFCEGKPVVFVPSSGSTGIANWNTGAAAATGDWLVTMMDDAVLLPNWRAEVERTPNRGFVGLYEGFNVGFVGQWAISRAWAHEVMGGVLMIPHYKSWWADWETCDLAKRAGRYAVTSEVVLIHNHYTLGRSANDDTYRDGKQWHAQDEQTYKRRKAAGFPIDWAPAIQEQHANLG